MHISLNDNDYAKKFSKKIKRGRLNPRSCKYLYLEYNCLQPLKMQNHIGN